MAESIVHKVCEKCLGEAHKVVTAVDKEIQKCMACGHEVVNDLKKPLTQQPTIVKK